MEIKLASKHRGRLRCFLSAPFGCNVEGVVAALSQAGVECRRLDSLRPGSSITKTLAREIGRSDFVCAVLPTESPSASTFYELGIAVGAGMPVMILAETDAELPFDIADFPVGRMSLSEPSTVETAVRAMLSRLRTAIPPIRSSEGAISVDSSAGRSLPVQPRRKKEERQLLNSAEASEELQSLRRQELPHAAFENFVTSLFNKAGYLVSSGPTTDDRGVDLTIWLDEVAPIFSNPILVELKTDLTQRDKWSHAADQLHRYLNAAGAMCGLLVSLSPLSPDIPRYTTSLPLVITFSADELIPLIASGGLARELIRRRNAAVHGVAK